MRHGSLFSGIGGFDLAAEWMGWENVFHCEWNLFGQKVLKYYWPNAISYNDITKSTFTVHRGRIDILTGGFPCQPFSTAGQRKGTEDNRYLWPEMLRVIREVQPRYIVGENVRGLVNWSGGMVFDTVCAELEAEGYEVLPVLLPACAVNAPHRRDRIWFIAHSNHKRGGDGLGQVQGTNGEISEQNNHAEFGDSSKFITADSERIRLEHGKETGDLSKCSGEAQGERSESSESAETNGGKRNATDSKNSRCKSNEEINRWKKYKSYDRNGIRIILNPNGTESNVTNSDGIGQRRESNRIRKSKFISKNYERNDWETFPTVAPVCNGDDGLSNRLDGITFSKWRKESIKGGGNAIVPQVAFQIFKTIEAYEKLFY